MSPPALFFHRLSRSAGIFRDTKTSCCHVTGGLPPLNNACLFWEILPRAKAAFGIGSIIPAAALESDEGAAKYCGTSFCLFVCLWLVCLAIRQNQQPASHLNEVPAAVWFPQCPHFYKKDQTVRSKNRSYIYIKKYDLMVLVQLNRPVFTNGCVKIPGGSALSHWLTPHRILSLLCLSLAGIYEQTFLIQLQPTNPGCEDSLLSGVCSLRVKKVQYSFTSISPSL